MISIDDMAAPAWAGQTAKNELKSKVVAGYQLWFTAAEGDDGWVHWSKQGKKAAPGLIHVEMWPDVREYPQEALYDTGFDALAGGDKAQLFLSKNEAVIDLHFSWLDQYGIDGLAVQRFYSSTQPDATSARNHIQMVQASAEKYGKLFYVMYDMSGSGRHGDAVIDRIKCDWVYSVEQKGIVSSANYAYRGGKPVVCLWGLAESPKEPGRYPNAHVALSLVNWFKGRGYYVIGGLPDNDWPGVTTDYAAVYQALDMASPWTVGRYNLTSAVSWWADTLPGELQYCEKYGMDYMPVLFPGFAWSNMKLGSRPNEMPRCAGRFLWRQASLLAAKGLDTMYFAMFDEYDEGTALMKGAEDSARIPAGGQYFLTYAADGAWLSSDYYLRLAGAVGRLIRKEIEPGGEPPAAHSNGPVYWRNGFEMRKAMNETVMPIDVGIFNPDNDSRTAAKVLESVNIVSGLSANTNEGESHTGEYALKLTGEAGGGSSLYRVLIAPVKITAPHELRLTYYIKAADEAGRNVFVDLLFDDGSYLSGHAGFTLQPGLAGKWAMIEYDLNSAAGKNIAGVCAAFKGGGPGPFTAYVDDISIHVNTL